MVRILITSYQTVDHFDFAINAYFIWHWRQMDLDGLSLHCTLRGFWC